MSDDAKKTILARRAKFIAAAVASVGIACGKSQEAPMVCLSVPINYDATVPPEPPPQPCLSPMPSPPDAAIATEADATTPDAGDATSDAGKVATPNARPTAPPRPCLTVRPPTREPRKQ